MHTSIPQKVDIVFDNTESIATSDIIAFEMADIESRVWCLYKTKKR